MAGLLDFAKLTPEEIAQLEKSNKRPRPFISEADKFRMDSAARGATQQGAKSALGRVGSGLLSAGKTGLRIVGSPVVAGLMSMEPTMMGNAELTPEIRERLSAGSERGGQGLVDWADDYSKRTIDEAKSVGKDRGLLQYGVEQPPQVPQTPQPPQAPKAPKETSVEQEVQQQTQTLGDPAVEKQRQVVEEGTKAGLRSGEVKVSELADGIVRADNERAGKQLTPDQHREAVAEEVKALKTMNQDDMSRYVSYALIAGGLLASALDKSGDSGRMFHESYNRQLDRASEAEAASLANLVAQQKLALEERKVDITGADVSSKIENRGTLADLKGREVDQGDVRLGQSGQRIKDQREIGLGQLGVSQGQLGVASRRADTQARQANIAAETNRLRGEDWKHKQDIASRRLELDKKKYKATPQAATDKWEKGATLSTPDAKELVKTYYDSQGYTAKPDFLAVAAARLPVLQNTFPQNSIPELLEMLNNELGAGSENPRTEVEGRYFGRDPFIKMKNLQEK